MTPERFSKVKSIFVASLDAERQRRKDFVAAACGGRNTLYLEVIQLLLAHEEAGDYLESGIVFALAAPAPDTTVVRTGERLGAYRILGEIGRGGMGTVYLAERADESFRLRVAIKVMRPGCGADVAARFRRERQILADLNHPNIARLLDGGTTPGGAPYVVMEYVEGWSLRRMLQQCSRQSERLPLAHAVEIVKQVGLGLHAAHRAGIVHRDIKPENIIVIRTNGQVTAKILDFGVAKLHAVEDAAGRTATGVIVGTPMYTSPEQALAEKDVAVDARSDIYALGAVLYELLAGRTVFEGETWVEILRRHVQTPPTPFAQLRPGVNVPHSIERVVLRALEKEPARRQASALEFVRDLECAYYASLLESPTVVTDTIPAAFAPANTTDKAADDVLPSDFSLGEKSDKLPLSPYATSLIETASTSPERPSASAAVDELLVPTHQRAAAHRARPDLRERRRLREQRQWIRLTLVAALLVALLAPAIYWRFASRSGRTIASRIVQAASPEALSGTSSGVSSDDLPMAPVPAATTSPVPVLRYRVWCFNESERSFETLEERAVNPGTPVYFEFNAAQPGTLYVFVERRDGMLWFDAQARGEGRALAVGEWLSIPGDGAYRLVRSIGAETFWLVYIPPGADWSPLGAAGLGRIAVNSGGASRGAALIAPTVAAQLKASLEREALPLIEERGAESSWTLIRQGAPDHPAYARIVINYR